MASYDLVSFNNPSALAEAAAEAWLSKIRAIPFDQSRPYCVALSGGRIARQFFSAIVQIAERQAVSFAKIHFFWADERCVPPTDPESNFAVADQLLFRPLRIAPEQIHRIRGEIAPEEAARQGAAELRRVAPPDSIGQPVLDMIFLGMGEDGHVASLFPEMPPERIKSDEVYQAVTASKPPPRRITLTYEVLGAARDVAVLASGAGKAEALQRSLALDTQRPLGRLLTVRAQTTIFSDVV